MLNENFVKKKCERILGCMIFVGLFDICLTLVFHVILADQTSAQVGDRWGFLYTD